MSDVTAKSREWDRRSTSDLERKGKETPLHNHKPPLFLSFFIFLFFYKILYF